MMGLEVTVCHKACISYNSHDSQNYNITVKSSDGDHKTHCKMFNRETHQVSKGVIFHQLPSLLLLAISRIAGRKHFSIFYSLETQIYHATMMYFSCLPFPTASLQFIRLKRAIAFLTVFVLFQPVSAHILYMLNGGAAF